MERKVTVIEESKDLSSLALDELIGNLKVHEVFMEMDSEIYRGKKERVKSINLKAKKEFSDDETSKFGSNDEEYAMAVCLRTCLELDEWIKDSGCSKYMIGNKSLFSTHKAYDEGVLLGYSQNSKAYIVLNNHTIKVKESLNVTFDESPPPTKLSPLVDHDVGEEEAIKNNTKVVNNNNEEDESIEVDEVINIKESKNHPLDQVI
uniref:Transposon protein, putative, CACTA, En/Spm sub-class n=1 Tax=Tanacetum cinerariifolium TaxID=118510 RepID=A0A6L2NCY1_TANCI|nr:transposon protein, putative, CACTA, En/Spm sub-class [Tanacetum cinerariifolium]